MKRAIILVIDSLGVGCMEDYAGYRPEDAGANTFRHILDQAGMVAVPNMEKLGIGKILNHPRLKENTGEPLASYGVMRLAHHGADSYQGHQEIMGSQPLPPLIQSFAKIMDDVALALKNAGFQVRTLEGKPILIVNDFITVADNIEADFGQIYNVTGAFPATDYETVLAVGRVVRAAVQAARVVALGGNVSMADLLNAVECSPDGAWGVNCPKSGVYNSGYKVQHMGYGIDPENQAARICVKNGLPVTLIGKMADVIDCQGAEKIIAVETEKVMLSILSAMSNMDRGLISATVQETDLSGHLENPDLYALKVSTVDAYLGTILSRMADEDLLIITADHGNDPTIGHSHHTREKTFLLAYSKKGFARDLGERSTLSDAAATVCAMFGLPACENGHSFYEILVKK